MDYLIPATYLPDNTTKIVLLTVVTFILTDVTTIH